MNARQRISRTHRFLGLISLLPLLGWIVSSFVLHGVGLFLPETGLRGEYRLVAEHVDRADLRSSSILPPDSILDRLAAAGLDRIYWLRLDQLGAEPAWIVKPGPFESERTYDAYSGARLDPLPVERLRSIVDAELVGTTAAAAREGAEFNRYYAASEVPTVTFEMEGEQPSTVVLERGSGRTLGRTDPLAAAFSTAYRTLHIWQWGQPIWVFTGILFLAAGIALVAVLLGYVLWWDRRTRRKRWTDQVRTERRLHAKFAPVAGIVLATQMLVGAYLWFNLGVIEPRFRGQGSFRSDWAGGIPTSEHLPTPSEIDAVVAEGGNRPVRVQRYEWRAVGDERFAIAYPRKDDVGVVVDLVRREVVDGLSEEQARVAGEMVVLGEAVGAGVEAEEYWMDFNRFIPTWRFRFSDPDASDVHISASTGEVIQRRPEIWRAFGPFLTYHTFGFTGNAWIDTILLGLMQAVLLLMMITGFRLSRRPARS